MNNQVINLLANGSFEETGSWNSVSENGAKITFCDTKQHHTGKSACKITLNGTGNEGSAACEQTVTVKEKGTYAKVNRCSMCHHTKTAADRTGQECHLSLLRKKM